MDARGDDAPDPGVLGEVALREARAAQVVAVGGGGCDCLHPLWLRPHQALLQVSPPVLPQDREATAPSANALGPTPGSTSTSWTPSNVLWVGQF